MSMSPHHIIGVAQALRKQQGRPADTRWLQEQLRTWIQSHPREWATLVELDLVDFIMLAKEIAGLPT
jgi:hypothetical protein